MSVRSVYTYIDKGLFTARNIDLKRKTKFRPRKCHKTQITNREVFSGRMYSDFLLLDPDYIERAAEMDTVHSSRDSKKVLLTFYLRKEKLFFAFLMNRCTTGAVRTVFDRLKNRLDTDFHLLFHTILTDRGQNSVTQTLWKPAYTEKNAPASSTVTLCGVDKKAVLKTHTPCSEWFSQKAPVLNF